MYEFVLLLIAMNFMAFAAFVWDKSCAERGRWRIRESTLLQLALFGGSIGAFTAQRLVRHKTRKEPFRTQMLMIGALHLLLVGAMAFPPSRAAILGLFG